MSRRGEELIAKIAALTCRVDALETKRGKNALPTPARDPSTDVARAAVPATDSFATSMAVRALASGLRSFKLVRCADDYYDWILERRRRHLGAPSTAHLCKSIVMCNTYWKGDEASPDDRFNAKYYCCVVSYATKLSAADLMRIVKRLNEEAGRPAPTNKDLHFRLAEGTSVLLGRRPGQPRGAILTRRVSPVRAFPSDCVGVTGYSPNGVTPIGLKTSMPVVLDRDVARLEPPTFWMGGGEVNLKVSVDVADFIAAFDPIIGAVTP
jgi:hypothetical protein